MAKSDPRLPIIQEILFQEWDPIGVNGYPQCRDEYDLYAPTILELLRGGADELKIAKVLSDFQRVSMGMSVIDEELHQRVARRLVALTRCDR
jgi:hypothetical protein